MWGTEYSGPKAAVKGAFENIAVVICNKENSDADALLLIEKCTGYLACTCCIWMRPHMICMQLM